VRIADISEGGCYVDTILEVTKGETLFLKIRMPIGEWIEVEGVVAHHSPRLGFGVRFVDPDKEQRRLIRSLMEGVNASPEKPAEVAWSVEQVDVACRELM
jgi:hypothetical protein